MKNVGFIGWRGMVGSVLMDRMVQEQDFANINPVFFTTSQAGQKPLYSQEKEAGELKKCIRTLEELQKIRHYRDLQVATILMKFIQN